MQVPFPFYQATSLFSPEITMVVATDSSLLLADCFREHLYGVSDTVNLARTTTLAPSDRNKQEPT